MTKEQTIVWQKYCDDKPKHNEFCLFCVDVNSEDEGKDLSVMVGQFKRPCEEEPKIYLPEWEFFVLLNNSKVLATENTYWVSLTKTSEEMNEILKKELKI